MGACCAKPLNDEEIKQQDVADGTPIVKDVVVPVSETKKALVTEFYQKLINHGGDEKWYENVCTADCMFNPPDAPPMPVADCSALFNEMCKSFPDWKGLVVVPAQEDSKELEVHTQQQVGNFKSDLPALGPFHAVTLDEASERSKTGEPLCLPFERGTVTFSDDGTKIANIKYPESSIVREASLDGVTSMDLEPAVTGIYCLFRWLGKPLPVVPDEKIALCKKFMQNLIKPESDEWAAELCTEECTFNPPGAPPMPIKDAGEVFSKMMASFPDWEPRLKVPDQPDAVTITCYTQQYVGNIKADMPESGPFPAVALADASERAKTGEPLCLPWERGMFQFNEEGTKIAMVTYGEDSVVENSDMTGVTSMDLEPPVGMVCLYKWLGQEWPSAPAADQI